MEAAILNRQCDQMQNCEGGCEIIYPWAVYWEGPEIFNSHATLQDGRSMEAAILWIGGGPGRREVPDDVFGRRNGLLTHYHYYYLLLLFIIKKMHCLYNVSMCIYMYSGSLCGDNRNIAGI